MAKLYVLFVGLMGLTRSGGRGLVLVREASGDAGHGKVPIHVAQIVHNGQVIPLSGAAAVRFRLTSSDSFAMQDSAVLKVGDVAGGSPTVRPECAAGESSCRNHLAARVVDLVGALHSIYVWRPSSGHLHAKKGAEIKLKGRHDPTKHDDADLQERRIANGLLLETNVTGNVFLSVEGQEVALQPASPQELARIGVSPQDEAYVVWVENLPEDDSHHGLRPGDRAHDHHFDLLYELMTGFSTRWVPIVETPQFAGRADFEIRVAPGSQCITPELS